LFVIKKSFYLFFKLNLFLIITKSEGSFWQAPQECSARPLPMRLNFRVRNGSGCFPPGMAAFIYIATFKVYKPYLLVFLFGLIIFSLFFSCLPFLVLVLILFLGELLFLLQHKSFFRF